MGKLKAVKMETLAAFLSFHSISFPSEWGGDLHRQKFIDLGCYPFPFN
jgi:hypothetical protein